jgi:3-methyladenine DNA glycosylase AlkC
MTQEKLLLKDMLFNEAKVNYLSELIKSAHPYFESLKYTKKCIKEFPKLELKARSTWMRKCLKEFLPSDYKKATNILIKALPPKCDPTKTDGDFGEFILAPVSDFIASYGCTKEHLDFSLNALEEMTMRFSVEDSIRFFISAFPKETLNKIADWSKSENYHVRRLSSEGTRPRLPWSQKVHLDDEEVITRILDNLYHDPTRYVVRSVANHLNDISKENPALVIQTLKRWQSENKTHTQQSDKELDFLTRHSLRTLIKKGDTDALDLLGFHKEPQINIENFQILTEEVEIGGALEFSFEIHSTNSPDISADQKENLMLDYRIHFQNKKGDLKPKVFKIKKLNFKKGDHLTITKSHPLKIMTTKKLYPGLHKVDLQINGKLYPGGEFQLI